MKPDNSILPVYDRLLVTRITERIIAIDGFVDRARPMSLTEKVMAREVANRQTTPHLMHMPIIIASGSDDPEHVRDVYALNGNCFMRKPHA